MRNIRLDIEYDGTNYAGWQRQENGTTVQACIEDVLSQVLQQPITILGAGRTDAGVHARGQVANFKTDAVLLPERIGLALNGLLPRDIVIRNVADVAPEFHARYSATSRRYSYTISAEPKALERNIVWHCKYDLDENLLRTVAKEFVGDHNFQAFCRAQSEVEHHRCIVSKSEWEKNGALLIYHVQANRFLHGMVRTLVGTMVDISRGFRSIDELAGILTSLDRTKAGPAAPPQGLVLEEITY